MNLYQKNILDHSKNPRNHTLLEDPSASSHKLNPFCGDEITCTIKIATDILQNIGFTGQGCAISQASASILYEYARGKSLEELAALTADDMVEMLGIPLSPTRLKCAILAKDALQEAIKNSQP